MNTSFFPLEEGNENVPKLGKRFLGFTSNGGASTLAVGKLLEEAPASGIIVCKGRERTVYLAGQATPARLPCVEDQQEY